MAEPARRESRGESEPDDELSGTVLLQRWIERPDGRMELLEIPLTPADFLDPQLEDKMVQGRPHSRVRHYLIDLLGRHFHNQPDVMVLDDLKHLLGPGLPGPAPDVSIVRGARDPDPELESFDVVKQGVVPCLIIEVVSPSDVRIRRTDEVDKVKLYEKIGIPEYLLVDIPRRATGHRFRLKGYRLGSDRRYAPIGPDDQGCLLSETTGLRFGVSPAGDRIDIFDVRTGERLRSSLEEEEGRKAEQAAREAAEEEVRRLRAEIERLKKPER
jgi:Uma2 family endonuclease